MSKGPWRCLWVSGGASGGALAGEERGAAGSVVPGARMGCPFREVVNLEKILGKII